MLFSFKACFNCLGEGVAAEERGLLFGVLEISERPQHCLMMKPLFFGGTFGFSYNFCPNMTFA